MLIILILIILFCKHVVLTIPYAIIYDDFTKLYFSEFKLYYGICRGTGYNEAFFPFIAHMASSCSDHPVKQILPDIQNTA